MHRVTVHSHVQRAAITRVNVVRPRGRVGVHSVGKRRRVTDYKSYYCNYYRKFNAQKTIQQPDIRVLSFSLETPCLCCIAKTQRNWRRTRGDVSKSFFVNEVVFWRSGRFDGQTKSSSVLVRNTFKMQLNLPFSRNKTKSTLSQYFWSNHAYAKIKNHHSSVIRV